MGVVEVGDGVAGLFCQHVCVADIHAGGRDRLADQKLDWMRLYVKAVQTQCFIGPDQCHGNDTYLRLDGEIECAAHEGLQPTILGATAFGKNQDRHACFQTLHRSPDAVHGFAQVLLVNWNLARASQMPPHKWVAKQLLLRQDSELKWQVLVQHWNIQGGKMVYRIDVHLAGVKFIETVDRHIRADGAQNHSRPQACKPVLNPAISVEKGGEQGEAAEHNGVEPDQEIPKKIRAQTRKPVGNSPRRFRSSGRLRLSVGHGYSLRSRLS